MNATQIGLEVITGTRGIVDAFESDGRLIVVTAPADEEGLTERQIDVCRLASEGHADKWIGYELGIARSTVATHLSAAIGRLNLASRTDVARVWPMLDARVAAFVMEVALNGRTFVALVGERGMPEIEGLTEAEHEVMSQAVRGASNREIATSRGTSTRTVANQLASIYRKLGLCSRTELAAFLTLPAM